MVHRSPHSLFLKSAKGIGANANSPLEKLCNWRALIEGHGMEVHSTGVQWPAPLQGPHLLIRGSPLPGKYASAMTNIFTRSPTQTCQGRHCGLVFFSIFFSLRACKLKALRDEKEGATAREGGSSVRLPAPRQGYEAAHIASPLVLCCYPTGSLICKPGGSLSLQK